MAFDNPMTGSDGQLIISKVRSPNYVAGVSGWIITKAGAAEFNSITVRGDVIATSFKTDVAPNDRIEITSVDLGQLVFYAQNATDPSLQLRSFNVANSQYIGAVEGPDNHPTQGRPVLYLLTDDGSISSNNVQAALGVLLGPQIILDGGGSANLFTTPTGPFISLSDGVNNTVTIASSSVTGPTLQFNDTLGLVLIESNPSGPYISLDNVNDTAVISNNVSYLEVQSDNDLFISAVGNTIDMTDDGVFSRIKLDPRIEIVTAGSAASPGIYFNTDSNSGIYQPAADQLGFSTNGTNRMTITNTVISFANGLSAPGIANSAAALQPVHYDTTFVVGTLYRFTSSIKYKLDVIDAPIDGIKKVLELRPTEFQPYQPSDGRLEGNRRIGFIAEEAHELGWSIADDKGEPCGVDTEQIVASLVAVTQRIYAVLTPAQKRKLWE